MNILDNIRSAVSIAKKYRDTELMEHLINLQTSYTELSNRFSSLEKENEALKKRVSTQGSLVVEHGVYFSETTDKKDGPFCTRSWDSDHKLLRLQVLENGIATCPECKSNFNYQWKAPKGVHAGRGFRA